MECPKCQAELERRGGRFNVRDVLAMCSTCGQSHTLEQDRLGRWAVVSTDPRGRIHEKLPREREVPFHDSEPKPRYLGMKLVPRILFPQSNRKMRLAENSPHVTPQWSSRLPKWAQDLEGRLCRNAEKGWRKKEKALAYLNGNLMFSSEEKWKLLNSLDQKLERCPTLKELLGEMEAARTNESSEALRTSVLVSAARLGSLPLKTLVGLAKEVDRFNHAQGQFDLSEFLEREAIIRKASKKEKLAARSITNMHPSPLYVDPDEVGTRELEQYVGKYEKLQGRTVCYFIPEERPTKPDKHMAYAPPCFNWKSGAPMRQASINLQRHRKVSLKKGGCPYYSVLKMCGRPLCRDCAVQMELEAREWPRDHELALLFAQDYPNQDALIDLKENAKKRQTILREVYESIYKKQKLSLSLVQEYPDLQLGRLDHLDELKKVGEERQEILRNMWNAEAETAAMETSAGQKILEYPLKYCSTRESLQRPNDILDERTLPMSIDLTREEHEERRTEKQEETTTEDYEWKSEEENQ